jgi:hypothetical protein
MMERHGVDFVGFQMKQFTDGKLADARMQLESMAFFENKHVGLFEFNVGNLNDVNSVLVNKMFRLSLIRKNGIDFPATAYDEDIIFVLSYKVLSKRAYFIDRELYYRVRREGSMVDRIYNMDFSKYHENLEAALYFKNWVLSRKSLRHYWAGVDRFVESTFDGLMREMTRFVQFMLTEFYHGRYNEIRRRVNLSYRFTQRLSRDFSRFYGGRIARGIYLRAKPRRVVPCRQVCVRRALSCNTPGRKV